MSLNDVLPWWVCAVKYEQHLAMCSCAFTEEWCSGTSKELPKHVVDLIKRNEKDN
jgi:hypothetical protein